MGIEFNPINRVKSQSNINLGTAIQKSLGYVFSTSTSNFGVGTTVENPVIAELEKHYSNVPEFEYNTTQQQLVIKGPLMGGSVEEMAEV